MAPAAAYDQFSLAVAEETDPLLITLPTKLLFRCE